MTRQSNFLTCLTVLLAALVIAWPTGPAFASKSKTAPSASISQDALSQARSSKAAGKTTMPILTKSGRKAAIKKAADAIQAGTPLVPSSPVDETKVPHYFGPFPNWANSPFTLPDANVAITGDGTGATAVATVGLGGAVTGITLTSPGSGYTTATVTISPVAGTGSGATADAVINTSGAVTGVTIATPGSGYTTPQATITGGGTPTTPAAVTVYGGVDAVDITPFAGITGYKFPTVDFDMPDGADGVKAVASVQINAGGEITGITVTQPGSGYSYAPNVVVRDGTLYDPILDGGPTVPTTATLTMQTVSVDTPGVGYTSTPTVTISDTTGIGSGATATAATDLGTISAINLTAAGSGYITPGGMKKFQDQLPLLCNPAVAGECASVASNLGQYIPLAVPDTTTFTTGNGFAADADYYVIAVIQTREQMHSDLPPTLIREYVQLKTNAPAHAGITGVPLYNEMLDGTQVPAMMPDGVTQAVGIDNPHFLGPLIVAQKDRAVRVIFYNLLPTGSDGDLFMAKDATIMGSGYGPLPVFPEAIDLGTVMDEVRNPECTDFPSNPNCFIDNRATLHLHGGITPWISDGTPHQWITPKGETTPWPQGASVLDVPDMAAGFTDTATGVVVPNCSGEYDGCQSYYWTNQQSARLMFYHDHAWGITRLNVIAGEAAGYLITDPTDNQLVTDGILPADEIPLVVQDRTFVPDVDQLAWQDPTWDYSRWGGKGNIWYHHVYMPAQNPGDPSGMSAYGRWMYGPWFWPPATPKYGPIENPYYDPNCDYNNPLTWQYDTDPFCEPNLIPGTPNISVGMEQFNDTPIVNGTAYPTITVDPKSYRLRILNAANDRFFNLSLYVADPGSETDPAIGPTEVALNPAELAAAQIDPNIFPTPDTSVSPPGPNWIVVGSEGGFLPKPVVVPPQPTTWIIDPTVFNVGNVDKHSLLIAPAERFDVVVDFSQYAGQTIILYNDAPAAFPARVSTYDYYTGAPDLMPIGAPAILPGYGPNTRTVMQIKVANTAAADPFDLARLEAAFRHHADGSGVFESSQHPIIVGQSAYNSAYGTSFVMNSYCNGGNATPICDGYLRIADQGGTLFGFNTLLQDPSNTGGTTFTSKLEIPIEPKAIHDEMNAVAFDEFGRMTANIGLEAVPATPAAQNITLYPFVNPPTEMFDATNLPKNSDIEVKPVSFADGMQIWKITHNGVDTHPLHWHLYDLQVLNRVTWDNIVSPPDPTELGWKDTLRVSPLEDTIVAIRPIIPALPFNLPNSIRPLHPMIPIGETIGFNNIDAAGNPTNPIVNQLVNFGWEYVWHCHILSHEEMDMMRPQAVAMQPEAPVATNAIRSWPSKSGGTPIIAIRWDDNSITETQFLVQRKEGNEPWITIANIAQPLDVPNTTGTLTYVDQNYNNNVKAYRIVAENTIGYGGEFKEITTQSFSQTLGPPEGEFTLISAEPPANIGGPVSLTWSYIPSNPIPVYFTVFRADDSSFQTGTVTFFISDGTTRTYSDTTAQSNQTYYYKIRVWNFLAGRESNILSVTTP